MFVKMLSTFCLTTALVAMLSGCGASDGKNELKELLYSLARTATNKKTNTLFLGLAKPENFTFSVDGSGFVASVVLGKRLPIQDFVQFSYNDEGVYNTELKFYYKDGSIFLRDDLSWEYSLEVPPDPAVSFSEEATNDQDVSIVIPRVIGENTTELWVEGDVVAADVRWHTILDDLTVPIRVTEEDGMKQITVKYRNKFGTESTRTADAQILKKSVGPTNCHIITNTTVTGSGSVDVYMAAENDGDLYYHISGDITGSSSNWGKFSGSSYSKTVSIIDNNATNTIKVQLRDIAGNYCPSKTFKITYDESHESFGIKVKDDVLWTDDPIVTVYPHIDAIPSDDIQMYIHGDILISPETFTWIDYKSSLDVTLNPVDGNRHVRVKYRVNGVESVIKSTAIYLRPFIRYSGLNAPYTILLSEIVGLTSLTITGCTTAYNNIAPTTSVSCTPTGTHVSATYYLNDGTSFTRTTNVP